MAWIWEKGLIGNRKRLHWRNQNIGLLLYSKIHHQHCANDRFSYGTLLLWALGEKWSNHCWCFILCNHDYITDGITNIKEWGRSNLYNIQHGDSQFTQQWSSWRHLYDRELCDKLFSHDKELDTNGFLVHVLWSGIFKCSHLSHCSPTWNYNKERIASPSLVFLGRRRRFHLSLIWIDDF